MHYYYFFHDCHRSEKVRKFFLLFSVVTVYKLFFFSSFATVLHRGTYNSRQCNRQWTSTRFILLYNTPAKYALQDN